MIPRLTHQQFLVVGALYGAERPGRDLRQVLRDQGVRKSGPAFYQMMARLEDAGLVTGRYDQQIVDGQILRERHYRATGDGLAAWRKSRDFYTNAIRGVEEGLSGA